MDELRLYLDRVKYKTYKNPHKSLPEDTTENALSLHTHMKTAHRGRWDPEQTG